ncbi:MAG: hypothetical protein M0Z31_05095 [Clostridia bacterium]|nr:hypothetical protein [Clostridia bacterium]
MIIHLTDGESTVWAGQEEAFARQAADNNKDGISDWVELAGMRAP